MKIINKKSGAIYGYYETLNELCDAIIYDLNFHESYIIKFENEGIELEMSAFDFNAFFLDYPTVIPINSDVRYLTQGERYKILSRFKTDLTGSGLCVVVFNNAGEIRGYCAANFHFLK